MIKALIPIVVALFFSGCICCSICPVDTCALLPSDGRDICYAGLAVATDNAKMCDKIDSKEDQESCLLTVSIKKEDEDICDDLEDTKMNCYLAHAYLFENDKICDSQFEGVEKYSCYFLAGEKMDKYCEDTTNEKEKIACEAFFKQDESICNQLSTEDEVLYCKDSLSIQQEIIDTFESER